jgi:hypothetical protein
MSPCKHPECRDYSTCLLDRGREGGLMTKIEADGLRDARIRDLRKELVEEREAHGLEKIRFDNAEAEASRLRKSLRDLEDRFFRTLLHGAPQGRTEPLSQSQIDASRMEAAQQIIGALGKETDFRFVAMNWCASAAQELANADYFRAGRDELLGALRRVLDSNSYGARIEAQAVVDKYAPDAKQEGDPGRCVHGARLRSECNQCEEYARGADRREYEIRQYLLEGPPSSWCTYAIRRGLADEISEAFARPKPKTSDCVYWHTTYRCWVPCKHPKGHSGDHAPRRISSEGEPMLAEPTPAKPPCYCDEPGDDPCPRHPDPSSAREATIEEARLREALRVFVEMPGNTISSDMREQGRAALKGEHV